MNGEHSDGSDISCYDLEVFHLNERRSTNPRYEEIKRSISVKGVKETLHVVFHPVRERWVLSHGGQTRLRICKELFEETGNEKFKYPPIKIEQYTSDLDLCCGHMIENELRGDTSFVEKSTGLLNISTLITDRDGIEPTQTKLSEVMEENGLPIRRQSITAMLYTAKVLIPRVTNVNFIEVLSRKTVDAIRSIRQKHNGDEAGKKFDDELITFINSRDGDITIKNLKDAFEEKPTLKAVESNRKFAEKLASSVGLENTIVFDYQVKSGFLVKLPDKVENTHQAIMLYILASLSGVFDQTWSKQLTEKVGMPEVSSGEGNPQNPIKRFLERLKLTELDVFGGLYKMSSELDQASFNTIMKLISGIRSTCLERE